MEIFQQQDWPRKHGTRSSYPGKSKMKVKPVASKKRFLQVLKAKGYKLASLSPADGIAVMLDWYREERADGCDLRQGGDMFIVPMGLLRLGRGRVLRIKHHTSIHRRRGGG